MITLYLNLDQLEDCIQRGISNRGTTLDYERNVPPRLSSFIRLLVFSCSVQVPFMLIFGSTDTIMVIIVITTYHPVFTSSNSINSDIPKHKQKVSSLLFHPLSLPSIFLVLLLNE